MIFTQPQSERRGQVALALILITLPLISACRTARPPQVDLTPPGTNATFRVPVSDSDEAGLLVQELGIAPVTMEGAYLVFSAPDQALSRLAELGYAAQAVDSRSISHRVVKIPRKGREEDLLKHGVTLLLREKKHWIVRGNLGQLESLRSAKYRLLQLDQEPLPRQVEVTVKMREDIQRIANLHVDIYSVTEESENNYTVRGGAFDYQIDALRRDNFEVKVNPN